MSMWIEAKKMKDAEAEEKDCTDRKERGGSHGEERRSSGDVTGKSKKRLSSKMSKSVKVSEGSKIEEEEVVAAETAESRLGGKVEEESDLVAQLVQWSLCWLAGWLGLSYSWLLLAILLHRRMGQKRKGVGEGRLRQVEVESLPSWVTFPSVDRVEWINILLEKVWPRIGGMVQVRPPPLP